MSPAGRISGRVEHQMYAAGSKSEHRGVVLTTDDGDQWLLRRRGAPPVADEMMETLVGKRVDVTGVAHRDVFFVDDWAIAEGDATEPAGSPPPRRGGPAEQPPSPRRQPRRPPR